MKRKHRLAFPILRDAGNAYAKLLSLAFALPDDLQQVYAGFGVSLPECNGDDAWELPLPTRIVTDASGVIRSIDAHPDYTQRPEPEASVNVLRSLS